PPAVPYPLSLHDALPISGSRNQILGDAMSILARSVHAPSGNSPFFIRVKRSRFSPMERLRNGLSLPGRSGTPRYLSMSSDERSRSEEHTSELQSRSDLVC